MCKGVTAGQQGPLPQASSVLARLAGGHEGRLQGAAGGLAEAGPASQREGLALICGEQERC